MAAAAEFLGNLAREAGSRTTEWLRGSEIGSQILDTVGSQLNEGTRSPEGMKFNARMASYDLRRQQILGDLAKPVQAISSSIKNDPTALRSTIGKLHSDFQAQGHPNATHTGNIIAQDPKNAQLTLQAYNAKINGQARLLASEQVLGPNHAHLIADIIPLYEKGDPASAAHANALLDIASNQLYDASHQLYMDKDGNWFKSGVAESSTKINMRKALASLNSTREASGLEPLDIDLKNFNTKSVHEKSNLIEKLASERARWYLAPMIAVNHMSTFFNYSQAPLTAIYKGMMGMGDNELKQLSDASSILTSQMTHELSADLADRTNLIASLTKHPEWGALYGQIFHNPGFNFIRKAQLKFGAAIGYHSAMHWAEGAAKGDKRSILELKELGLDPQAIAQRGGQLTRDEKVQAIYHFVNNRAFISRPLDRSLTATRNPWTRMGTMFHGYVTYQQAFMRRELQKMMDAGDYVGIARYAGTVGLMFPAVAPMLKGAEVFARTASAPKAAQGVQEDYKKLGHPENIGEFTSTYLDMLSYFGSWGLMHSFIGAAHGDRLALALMGPIAGDAVRTAQDAINLTTRDTKTGKHNIKPLAKDLLQQSVPGAGNIIANQIFPGKQ